jgi:MFS family permease
LTSGGNGPRFPFFYGWVVVAGAAVNASFVLGSAQFALSTFLVPMEEELGWSRAVFFGGLSIRYLLAGMLGPVVGPLADRLRAPRIVLPTGVLVLGGTLSSIRWVDHPLWFLMAYGILGALATALLNLTMWEAVILKWFSRRRTRALIMGSIGEASGPLIFPLLITLLVSLFGWRDAWLWYGVITVVVLLPFALAVKTRPEQVGQHLDGAPSEASAAPTPEPAEPKPIGEASFTRPEALRTTSFWLLASTFTLSGVVITGFQAQWIPHFRDIGYSAAVAAGAVSTYGALNIVSRVLWGTLAGRFELRLLMTGHAVAAAAGVAFLLFFVTNTATLFAWAAYQGLVLGSFFPLHSLLSTEYFGRAHIGAIRGTMMPPSSVSRSAGALLLGGLRDLRGSYTLSFGLVLGGWALMAAAMLFSRRPRMPASREATR